jgi:hypothetical protein
MLIKSLSLNFVGIRGYQLEPIPALTPLGGSLLESHPVDVCGILFTCMKEMTESCDTT